MKPLGEAPSWQMPAHSGGRLSTQELRGKVYLVSFIWTNCRDTCPILSAQMAQMQQKLSEEGLLGTRVVLVSISFDPERDTPARLSKYARVFRAEPGGWYFLTSSPEELERVITRGFGVSYRPFRPEGENRSNLADQLTPPLGETSAGASLSDVIGGEDVGQFLDIDYSIDFDHQNAFVLVDGEGTIRKYYVGTFLDRDEVMADIRSLVGR